MSTLESTVSMLEVLPDTDVQIIFNVTKELMDKHETSPFKPVTKEDVLHDLDVSEKDIEAGRYSTVDEMTARLKAKYGL